MRGFVLAAIISTLVSAAFSTPIHTSRDLPTPISADTARSYLELLTVAVDSNTPAYSRDLFKTWITISGKCDTRETVLKRDGTNVVTDSACKSTSGDWVSPYDGVPTTLAGDLDIDHVVPLKEAWVSGARDWTPAQREAFANDLIRPQLVAVTDNLNQSKGKLLTMIHVLVALLTFRTLRFALDDVGDRDPAHWLPPLSSYLCTYGRAWVEVKYYYGLTIDSAEKTALTNLLAGC